MRLRKLEKGKGPEIIDVDTASENAVVMYSAIEQLRGETEEGWLKLAKPLKEVIEANNALAAHLKKTVAGFSEREDIIDGRISRVRVNVDQLQAKVALGILDCLEAKNTDHLLDCQVRS